MNILNTPLSARQCAVLLLDDILTHKRSFDEALAHLAPFRALEERDRNFVRLLLLTTLRRLGQIDALLATLLERPLKGKFENVQHCLRLGVVQLLFLKTPPHAAVNSMVETAAELGFESMKGLVNATLKRIAKDGDILFAAVDTPRHSLPAWLYESWVKAYGQSVTDAIAVARLAEPPLDITTKDNPKEWAEKLGGTLLPSGSIRLQDAGRIEQLAGFAEGAWWVQDMAASLPIQLLGDMRGKTVIDLCAAPGGKTAQLASQGAHVTAVDKSKNRLARLEANMQRLWLSVTAIEVDILNWKPDFTPDAIVLDALCSATGTLRRNPEVVWHRSPEDVAKLVDIQYKLLKRAAKWLGLGGQLVYCVCSLQKEEGEDHIAKFLSTHPDFRIAPIPETLRTALPHCFTDNMLRTHPALYNGMDGFFAVKLERITQ